MMNMQYSIALTVTGIPYVLAELPSDLLLKVRSLHFFRLTLTYPRSLQIIGPNVMLPAMLTL